MRRLRRWTPASWAVPGDPAGAGTDPTGRPGSAAGGGRPAAPPSRAELAAAAVQRVADLGADAEGEPHRAVPRLGDAALADQLAVVVDDVLRAGDPAAARALAAELTALRAALGLPAR